MAPFSKLTSFPASAPAPKPARAASFYKRRADDDRMSANDLLVAPRFQLGTNACGTAALATVFSYFDQETLPTDLDPAIRPFNWGTIPTDIVQHANANGFRATMKNEGSLEDLTRIIDQGVPPIILVDIGATATEDKAFKPHYLVVSGYERDASGAVSHVITANPSGTRNKTPVDELMKEWSSLSIVGVPTGESRLMISIVPKGDRPVVAADGSSRPASSIDLPRSSVVGALKAWPWHAALNDVFGKAKLADRITRLLKRDGFDP